MGNRRRIGDAHGAAVCGRGSCLRQLPLTERCTGSHVQGQLWAHAQGLLRGPYLSPYDDMAPMGARKPCVDSPVPSDSRRY